MLKKRFNFLFFHNFSKKKRGFHHFFFLLLNITIKKIPHNKICIIKCNVDKYNINKIFRYTLFI